MIVSHLQMSKLRLQVAKSTCFAKAKVQNWIQSSVLKLQTSSFSTMLCGFKIFEYENGLI